jgi:DNA repair protein RecN (Recombination protein N)
LEQKARTLATTLHEQRSKVAPRLDADVEEILHKVGMEGALFCTRPTDSPLGASGSDNVEFLFTANAGVAPRAIERIASGGELSRVMLALKAILSKRLSLPTIVFDEIDTGVSGRVADAVGDIINTLSESMQVIDITHLPQVAAKGNTHLLVYKEQGVTHLRPLTDQERVVEIAKMLSGSTITDAALSQARHLLGK